MARETMTVRVEPRMRKALDGIAEALERDKTYVVFGRVSARQTPATPSLTLK